MKNEIYKIKGSRVKYGGEERVFLLSTEADCESATCRRYCH